MDTPAYDIVFSGALLAGRDPEQVRVELARLFKADAAGIERLFCGHAVIIKKGVDRQTADKYRAVLEKAGAVCEIRACASADKTAEVPARMTVAPAGTLLTSSIWVTPPVFDLGHMTLAAAGVDILEGVDVVAAAPLYDLTAFSVAEPGADIDTRGPVTAVVLPDVSRITLAPAGTAVIKPEEMKPCPVAPDITSLQLTFDVNGTSTR